MPFLLAFAAIGVTTAAIVSPGKVIGSISGRIEDTRTQRLDSSLNVRLDNGKSVVSAADAQQVCAPGARVKLDVRMHDWPWRRTSYRISRC